MRIPLAELMRPHNAKDIIGQPHLLGESGPLTRVLSGEIIFPMIMWGPPGVGKTTIAKLIAATHNYQFVELSGVSFSIKQLPASSSEEPLLVFVDEIHRLNKGQQAVFLPKIESGEWILIGATTENPSFTVIAPLLSRCKVIVLKSLSEDDLVNLLHRAIVFYKQQKVKVKTKPEVENYIVSVANGDARQLLGIMESLVDVLSGNLTDLTKVKESAGKFHLVYDRAGEEHYDTISALHKSMRGSDANAAVYYLARMLEGGEDPLYIARRCVRFAAEDIGNADRGALILANATYEACHKLGMPECDVILAQLVIYLASTKKSNQAYRAYNLAKQDVQRFGNLPIPLKIRNAPTKLMNELGYGKDYKYAHNYTKEELAGETYLPDSLVDKDYLGDS